MKNKCLKMFSVGMCSVLLAGSVGVTAYAMRSGEGGGSSAGSEKTEAGKLLMAAAESAGKAGGENDRTNSGAGRTDSEAGKNGSADVSDVTKEETVYVFAGADGSVQKIVVSDWLQNASGNAQISDFSELADVENVKGDEVYTMTGDNQLVWNAAGRDIYYQGNIEKEVPVDVSVSYRLDGKSISPDELAGKSGRVTIRFDYKNNLYEMKDIDGKQEKIYAPFAVLTGMILDDEVFSNLEVTNGKMVNDGDRIVVLGFAFPGLQSNLNMDADKFEFPDYLEITADVTDFEMANTVTVATNEIFSGFSLEGADAAEELSDALGELTDAMEQLMDGSSKIYDGLCTLADKSGELTDGINRLAEGAGALKDGAAELDNGAAQLQAGAGELKSGLDSIAANNSTLTSGAEQIFQSLLSTANAQIAAAGLSVPALTIDNYGEVLNGAIAAIDENAVYSQALALVTDAVEANRPMIREKVTEAVKGQVTAQVQAAVQEQVTEQVINTATGGTMTKESYEQAVANGLVDETTQETVRKTVAESMAKPETQALIAAKAEEQMKDPSVQNTIAENVELQIAQAISDNMASADVQDRLKEASEGVKALVSLKASLDGYNTFYRGLLAYTGGVASAAQGAGRLADGASGLKAGTEKLCGGTEELYGGASQLKSGAPALAKGVTALRDGSKELSEGLREFKEKGVDKLIDAVDGDVNGLITRLQATVDVSKNYRSFSGLSEGMAGKVKFIYRTEAVNAE